MEYFFSARIDGLVKREESPEEMTESYVDRDDFMYYRQVTFGKRVKKFGPQEANSRPIVVGYNWFQLTFSIVKTNCCLSRKRGASVRERARSVDPAKGGCRL